MKRITFAPTLLVLVMLAGCSGESGPETFTVSGTVTLDETPVENGSISFVPADGNGPTAGATIEEGTYTAEVGLGEKKVQITAPKVVGQRKLYDTPDSPTIDETEESIPDKYNTNTTLQANIEGNDEALDFSLTSE